MMEYCIVEENDPDVLTRSVNKAMLKGWQLHGSLNVLRWEYDGPQDSGTAWLYIQAMTRETGVI